VRASFSAGVNPLRAAGLERAASRFTSAKNHPVVTKPVAKMAAKAEERDALQAAMLDTLAVLAEQAKAAGIENDFSAGLAVLVATRHLFVHSTVLSVDASKKVAWQLQAALELSPRVR